MAERDSRWITIRQPFNFFWPSRAVTHYKEAGEFLVKNAVADFAVEKGFAIEGKLDGSAKSRKGKRPRKAKAKATRAAKSAKAGGDAAPDTGTDAGMGGTAVASADSAGAGQPVAPAAE